MSESVSPESRKQAEEVLAAKMVRPLDDMSSFSVVAVADAAETIAKAKLEAATRAAEAAREAMARVAAMKAAAAAPPAAPIPLAGKPMASLPLDSPVPAPRAVAAAPVASKPVPVAIPVAVTAPPVQAAVPVVERAKVETKPELKVAEAPEATPETAERRGGARRDESQRRGAAPDRRSQDVPVDVERRGGDRRYALGRRDDDPSGVFRLADAVRANTSAIADRRRSVNHGEAPKAPGTVLEPVARKAGHGPTHITGNQKVFTPKLALLFVLMGLFGAYATGHLPEFDQWTDSMVNKTHQSNDQVVGTITTNWHTGAYVVAGILLFLMVFMVWNSMRAHGSDE